MNEKKKFTFALLTIIFANIAFVSYFFSSVYLFISFCIIAYYYRRQIKKKFLILFISVFTISHFLYLDLVFKSYNSTHITDIIQGRNSVFEEIFHLAKQFVIFYGLNFNEIVSIPVTVLLIALLYFSRNNKARLIFIFCLSLTAFASIFLIDQLLNKHFVLCQRYFYISLPFVSSFIVLFLKSNFPKKHHLLTCLVICFSSLNSLFPALQHYKYCSFVYPETYKKAFEISEFIRENPDQKYLLLFPTFGGYTLIFMKYLKTHLEEESAIAKIDYRDPKYKNIFVSTRHIEKSKLLSSSKSFEKIFFIDYKAKNKSLKSLYDNFKSHSSEYCLLKDNVF
ncbi:MAG: hypothetical protein HRT47_12585 [Candidatus Caenarcaniphilales bacterium]|nr:hypothetical protein [Candidatus Caenarcaniphilales bacterium]